MEPFDLRAWPGITDSIKNSNLSQDTPIIIDQVAIDSRRISSKNALFIALSGSNFDGHSFLRQAYKSGARWAIVKKDWKEDPQTHKMTLIHVDDPLRALQQIAKCYRSLMKAKVVAITGSYGKTMLKDLLWHLMSGGRKVYASPESFNSQIGVALSLLKIKSSDEIALIETGISEIGEMQHLQDMVTPEHVIVTNLAKTRVGNIGSLEMLCQEKLKLAASIPENNWSLYPTQEHVAELLPKGQKPYFWDQDHDALPSIKPLATEETGALGYEIFFPDRFYYRGKVQEGFSYVIDLITIAVKAAYLLNVPPPQIANALSNYFPEPMRIEVWKSQNGVTLINDTYCADPMSLDVALKQFDSKDEPLMKVPGGKKIFLFGGLRKPYENSDCDMARIAQTIAKHQVDLLILWNPEIASQIVSYLSLFSPHTEVVISKTLQLGLNEARLRLTAQDTLLIKGSKKVPISELVRTFEESPPNNQVIINLAAIQSNIEVVRRRLGKEMRLMVMVKALAYGTDDIRIAKFLKSCGIDIVGVSYVDEGVAMRQAGVCKHIFVLNAAIYEAAKAVKWDLEVGVSEKKLIHSLQEQAAQQMKKIKVHLHVDTGMSRFGCRPEEVVFLAQEIKRSPNLIFEGIMTHFACADDPKEDAFTRRQAQILDAAIAQLEKSGISPPWRHACNSSAAIRFGFSSFNMVRLGLAVYGLHTSRATSTDIELKPAISLVSRIVGINFCQKGQTVSYGRSYTIDREQARIAVLPIGYFDGLHRNYSGKGFVRIRGKKAPMIGKICMDYMMVDITEIEAAQIGDTALLFGEDENGHYLAPEELANSGGSIVHELMTCLGPRIRRLFIYDESLRPR